MELHNNKDVEIDVTCFGHFSMKYVHCTRTYEPFRVVLHTPTSMALMNVLGLILLMIECQDQATTLAEGRSSGATVIGGGPSHHFSRG